MLERLKALQEDIRVAIIGMGAMGQGLLYQALSTPGFRCVAVADIDLPKAARAVEAAGREYAFVDSLEELHSAAAKGKVAVTEDGDLIARCQTADVLIEASSSVAEAGLFARTALEHKKHLVLMNAEVDLIIGPYLLRLARSQGLIYTSCDGDQHTVLKRLTDEIELWGMELVLAGNIKGYLDRYANPSTIVAEADKRHLDYKMATAYTDGTKLSIEMAILANALDMRALKPGMQGPEARHVREAFELFNLSELKGRPRPVVDYLLHAEPDGGVFVVGYCDDDYQRHMLSYYKMGDGPFYLFYRPYHLCHIEAMASVAEAVLDGRSLLEPTHGLKTNVFAYAKRDLKEGERLDGIGGYACYGLIENCPEGALPEGLPICLAEDLRLKRDIAKDEKILLDDVAYDPESLPFELYFEALSKPPSGRP